MLVAATSDQPAMMRLKCDGRDPQYEYFTPGQNVLPLMDLTRFAMAQREIGLATGSRLSQGGYTPSIYSVLPTA